MDYNIRNSKPNEIQGDRNVYAGKYTCFQDQVDEMTARLAERAEREVPEYGRFAPVMEFTPNYGDIKVVGKYGLQVYKLPEDIDPDPKQRHIKAAAYMPAGDYKASMAVAKGHKEEIIRILKDPEFAKKLNGVYGELVEILENQ